MIKEMDAEVGQKYVGFLLGGREYAIDINRIVEIIYFRKATPMPEAPAYVEGVVDLRGKVIPVVNLKKVLMIRSSGTEQPNHILILRTEKKLMGIVVDNVREVLQIPETQVQSPQEALEGRVSKHLKGVSRVGERMIFILSMEQLLTSKDAGLGEG